MSFKIFKQRDWNKDLTTTLQKFYHLPSTGEINSQSNYWIGRGYPMGEGWNFVSPSGAHGDLLISKIQTDLLQDYFSDGLAGQVFWRSLAYELNVEYYGEIVDKLYDIIYINPKSESLKQNLRQYQQTHYDNYCPVCGHDTDGILVGSSRLYECPICHEKWSHVL